MGDLVSRLKAEGPQIWRHLSIFQRATLVAVVVAAIGAIVFLTQWAQQPEYSAVFTGLSDTDAAAIVAQLKTMKVPYELADGGSTVRVPSNKVYDIRLQMVSQGLPKGGTVGYELFDKNNFGLTDFAQRVNYQRALEGELARTVMSISGVENAKVNIVMPQDQLFTSAQKPATASVVLIMKSGLSPTRAQVQGISTLVARSVEGLTPENVTIVDGNGTLLSGGNGSLADGAATSDEQAVQQSYEQGLQQSIQGMLEQVLGPRKAVVRVSSEFDWNQYTTSTETYSPNGAPTQVRSSQEVTESSTTPLGTLGASSGIPTYPLSGGSPAGPVPTNVMATPAATPQPNTTATPSPVATVTPLSGTPVPAYVRKQVTTNYEISKQTDKTVKTPGAVKRLSISVMLDGKLDDATVATVTKAVAAAAGVDPSRGDSIVVTSLPFDQTAATADQQAQKDVNQRNWYLDIAKYVLAGLSILLALLFVRSIVRGLVGTRKPPKTSGKVLKAGRDAAALPAAADVPALPQADANVAQMQGEVVELAKNQPQLVAGIIKTWLDER